MLELMVINAIVVMMAALVFPVFTQTREAAQTARCMANTKQLAFAYLLYTTDHDESCPPFGYRETDAQNRTHYMSWHVYFERQELNRYRLDSARGLLAPYVKSMALVYCPTASHSFSNPASFVCGYGMNLDLARYIFDPASGQLVTAAWKYNQIELPAETLVFGDTATINAYDLQVIDNYQFSGPNGKGSSVGMIHGRHGAKRANVSWLDGHAKSVYPQPRLYDMDNSPMAPNVTVETMRRVGTGDVLKFPRSNARQFGTAKDAYYYLVIKPTNL